MSLPTNGHLQQGHLKQVYSKRGQPRRWFIYLSSGMLIFLFLAIILAAFLLLRRGRIPRAGMITGSSMEPILRGPRFSWTCSECNWSQEFAFDTCKSDQPFRCQACNHLAMQSEIDFADPENLKERVRSGEQVAYSNLRSIRATRRAEIAMNQAQPSGLRRGDIVVFQESPNAIREVKRVVGFADEHVAIIDGDIYVNDIRSCKSLEQSLRQSILVHSWEKSSLLKTVSTSTLAKASWHSEQGEFQGALAESTDGNGTIGSSHSICFSYGSDSPIDNRLAVNAHDSHAIIPVHDIGVAFQPSTLETAWAIECELNTSSIQSKVSMQLESSSVRIRVGEQSLDFELIPPQHRSVWIVIAMIDGHLIAGNQDEEWFRLELQARTQNPNEGDEKAGTNSSPPIRISALSGRLELDQLMVFRDIHYRGHNDSEAQSWPPQDRLVVLGDNVSASSDSRDRWPDGLPRHSVKGVVLQSENPMEVLLRQR